MKRISSTNRGGALLGLTLIALAGSRLLCRRSPAPDKILPDFVLRELTHLEETYRILDITAEKTWPGWTDYRDFPFLLQYPNNLLVLIGHPNPPPSFEKVSGVKVEDKDVYADFSAVSTAKVEYPLMVGGGAGRTLWSLTRSGKPVRTVALGFASTDILEKGGVGVIHIPFCVELKILCYIHELFHCFQMEHIQFERVGNLSFNPDASYALYSTIEGYALLNATQAKTRDAAHLFMRDFLAARMLKRRASMPELQRRQESQDEILEGTAVFTEIPTLQTLSKGYETKLDLSKDTYYTGFRTPKPSWPRP